MPPLQLLGQTHKVYYTCRMTNRRANYISLFPFLNPVADFVLPLLAETVAYLVRCMGPAKLGFFENHFIFTT